MCPPCLMRVSPVPYSLGVVFALPVIQGKVIKKNAFRRFIFHFILHNTYIYNINIVFMLMHYNPHISYSKGYLLYGIISVTVNRISTPYTIHIKYSSYVRIRMCSCSYIRSALRWV